MRELIEKGYIYIAQPPLYKLKKGKQEFYVKDEGSLRGALLEEVLDETKLVLNKKGESIGGAALAKLIEQFDKVQRSINSIASKYPEVLLNKLIYTPLLDGRKKEKAVNDWAKKSETKAKEIRHIVNNVLSECYRLDEIGLDHGELSTIDKHVIVNKKRSTVIDFESSSIDRKTSNVSGATQAILIGTGLAKIIQKKIKLPAKNKIINLIRAYKKNPTQDTFENLLVGLKLESVKKNKFG